MKNAFEAMPDGGDAHRERREPGRRRGREGDRAAWRDPHRRHRRRDERAHARARVRRLLHHQGHGQRAGAPLRPARRSRRTAATSGCTSEVGRGTRVHLATSHRLSPPSADHARQPEHAPHGPRRRRRRRRRQGARRAAARRTASSREHVRPARPGARGARRAPVRRRDHRPAHAGDGRRWSCSRRASSSSWPDVPVVMLTAHGTVPLAVEAMKRGAADFVLKPFDRDELLFVVAQGARRPPSADATRRPRRRRRRTAAIVGASPAMRDVPRADRRAPRPERATVLLRGESGTGKELVARAIHDRSPRARQALRHAQLRARSPTTLLESELFGHEKGAFTGAVARKPGRVELADGGTLFLDEIGDIPARRRSSCCACCRSASSSASAAPRRSRSTCASSPPRTATSRTLDRRRARSARTSSTASTWCRSCLPPLRERPEDIARAGAALPADTLGAANGAPSVAARAERARAARDSELAGQRAPAPELHRAAGGAVRRRHADAPPTCGAS